MLNVLNFALFQIGWLTCVVGAARGNGWIGPAATAGLIGAHLVLHGDRRREIALLTAGALLGAAVDTSLLHGGRVAYSAHAADAWLCPPWIIAMWLNYATTVNASLGWMRRRPWAAATFGLVGGPLAYLAGERLGGVMLGQPRWLSLAALAIVWAAAAPGLFMLSEWFERARPASRSRTSSRTGGPGA